jgi:hypothetical protein
LERRTRRRLLVRLPLLAAAIAGPASAQVIDTVTSAAARTADAATPPVDRQPSTLDTVTPSRSLFARDRDIPVDERSFQGFQAVGLPLGWFRIYPQLGVSGEGTSNVYENNKREHGDFVYAFTPQITAQYDSSQLTLNTYVRGEIDRFAQFHSENADQGVVGFDATRSLPGYSSVFAGASYGYVTLSRLSPESPIDAGEPLRYLDGQGDIGGAYEMGRVRLTGRFDYESLHFDNSTLFGGGELNTADHDRSRYTGTAQVQYAISPATAVYVGGSYDIFDFRRVLTPAELQRDSHGYEAFVGSNFELTGVTKADVRVGYLNQDFNARQLGGISGLGVRGQVQYFPTRLTTVTFTVRRSVEDSGIPNTGGFLETGGGVSVDHEYRRYLVLNARANYYDDKYNGIDRHDGLAFVSAGATYLSTHHWNLKVAYEYYHQNSHGCDCSVNYDDHRAVATLTFQY